jgi:hypothetical protein
MKQAGRLGLNSSAWHARRIAPDLWMKERHRFARRSEALLTAAGHALDLIKD